MLHLSGNGYVLTVFLGVGKQRAGFIHWFRILPALGRIIRVMGICLIVGNLRDHIGDKLYSRQPPHYWQIDTRIFQLNWVFRQ